MSLVLQKLEPIKFEKGTMILDELDQVNEVTFIIADDYHIGFSINKDMHFKMKMTRQSIGDYYLTFNGKS